MKQVGGWWLPDSDRHFGPMLARSRTVDFRGSYQLDTLIAALNAKQADQAKRAIDIGAHVGFWSVHLAKVFARLDAFEPNVELHPCFHANMKGRDNWNLYDTALGEGAANIDIVRDLENTGTAHVLCVADMDHDLPRHRVQQLPLDAMEFEDVGFIKIDVEGYELFVLKGAVETLTKCKPTVVIEQKDGAQNYEIEDRFAAKKFLTELGAKEIGKVRDDYIFAWDD